MSDTIPDRLWTIRELAAYLNYQESTLAAMVSRSPEKLPPRVSGLGKPRWEPTTVRAWAIDKSRAATKKGRPRSSYADTNGYVSKPKA